MRNNSCAYTLCMVKHLDALVVWIPRILGIAFILFLTLFSLDVFVAGQSLQHVALGFFIHSIPSLLLLMFVLIAWKHEISGGVLFILAGFAYLVMVVPRIQTTPTTLMWALPIAGPAFIIGSLFMYSGLRKRTIVQ